MTQIKEMPVFDIQGHRGCRGLFPENTIPAFIYALELGVHTLEMDLVISMDKKVVVSHEPYFSSDISTDPSGDIIEKGDEKAHNIYQLLYSDIQKYDVGSRGHKKYPKQKKIKTSKPLFQQVVSSTEVFARDYNISPPFYNIEIKRKKKWDDTFHPSVEEFTKLVVDEVYSLGIEDRVIIQSFDAEALQITRSLKPALKTSLLVENFAGFSRNIRKLGYTPDIYSPNYRLVRKKLIDSCHQQNIKIIPWTVNSEKAILSMINLGVDGIISDYPDRVLKVYNDYVNRIDP